MARMRGKPCKSSRLTERERWSGRSSPHSPSARRASGAAGCPLGPRRQPTRCARHPECRGATVGRGAGRRPSASGRGWPGRRRAPNGSAQSSLPLAHACRPARAPAVAAERLRTAAACGQPLPRLSQPARAGTPSAVDAAPVAGRRGGVIAARTDSLPPQPVSVQTLDGCHPSHGSGGPTQAPGSPIGRPAADDRFGQSTPRQQGGRWPACGSEPTRHWRGVYSPSAAPAKSTSTIPASEMEYPNPYCVQTMLGCLGSRSILRRRCWT